MSKRSSRSSAPTTTVEPYITPGKLISFFIAVEPVGQGGFGDVWVVQSTEDDKRYAMKVELPNVPRQNLAFESEILRKLQGSKRFPQLKITGKEDGHCFMVEELLGPNLTTLVEQLPGSVVLTPYLPRLAKEMLLCIEDFHRYGYIHRDIKPQNYVVRLNGEVPICLIDYGIARQYLAANGRHMDARESAAAIGSPVYVSINVHNRQDCSRRDDLISWFYSVMALSQCRLPWLGKHLPLDEVGRMKTEYPLTRLAEGMSVGFQVIARHIEGLGFTDVPDYRFIYEKLDGDAPLVGNPFEWMDIDVDTGEAVSGGNWDPTGFVLKHSPWLNPREKDNCLLL
jgi:serine/threonine protein kinase